MSETRDSNGHTERQNFYIESALQLGFGILDKGDDPITYVASDREIVDLCERVEQKGWLDGIEWAANLRKKDDVRKNVMVSHIKVPWRRRLLICVTVPILLAYCLVWVPIAGCVNTLVFFAGHVLWKPFPYSWTAIRTAWEHW